MKTKEAAAVVIVVLIVIALVGFFATRPPSIHTNSSTSIVTSTINSSKNTTTTIQTTNASNASLMVPIKLTDPPHVPQGTQSLIISYSSLSVQTNSGTVNLNTSGTVNALALENVSQVVATGSFSPNTTIESVEFNVASASITINGTTYNLTLPSNQLVAKVAAGSKLNANAGILLDLSPTVISSYTNSTTLITCVPAMDALVVPNSTNGSAHVSVGAMLKLTPQEDQYIVKRNNANISISNASLTSLNGSGGIALSLSVDNSGNESALLNRVIIIGNETPVLHCTPPGSASSSGFAKIGPGGGYCGPIVITSNTTQTGNVVSTPPINGTPVHVTAPIKFRCTESPNPLLPISVCRPLNTSNTVGNVTPYLGQGKAAWNLDLSSSGSAVTNGLANGSYTINSTAVYKLNAPTPRRVIGPNQVIEPVLPNQPYINSVRAIDFLIATNGTLSLYNPGLPQCNGPYLCPVVPLIAHTSATSASTTSGNVNVGLPIEYINETGYVLNAGSTATFGYNGPLSAGSYLNITITPGARYTIEVIGNQGAFARMNVTAG